jgi:NTE family protein
MNQAATDSGTSRPSRRHGIGLCLSGGGFRSSIFHLGALWRLHELGVLSAVRLISSVSGGSIISAFLADRAVNASVSDQPGFAQWLDQLDFRLEIATPFRALVARDFRTWPVLKHGLWNWAAPGLRARQLERSYQQRLTPLKLEQLPMAPSFVFCATDLTHGASWEFRRQRSGSWQAGYLDSGQWPLARAVAASACFPPLFGPMRISAPASDFKGGRKRPQADPRHPVRIDLTDGGVYDNMGLEPAWKLCETVLVSDCGAPFEFSTGGTYVRRLMRYTSVIGNQALAVRKRMFFGGIRAGRHRGAYWGLKQSRSSGHQGYSASVVNEFISQIRTDLDRFTEPEFAVLVNHGYAVVDTALSRKLPNLAQTQQPFLLPYPDWGNDEAAARALSTSHRRFSAKRLFSG